MKNSKSRSAWIALQWPAGVAGLAAAILLAAHAAAQIPDADRGRALYENHCVVCHTPSVHTRPNKLAYTRQAVREIVEHWQRQQGLAWSDQDIDDVLEYLDRTRYHFAPVIDRLTRP